QRPDDPDGLARRHRHRVRPRGRRRPPTAADPVSRRHSSDLVRPSVRFLGCPPHRRPGDSRPALDRGRDLRAPRGRRLFWRPHPPEPRLPPRLSARDVVVSAAAPAQLELRGVIKRFGGVAAVDGVNFEIAKGDIVGIIGPNGAGKTTLLNCISGVYHLDGGDIRWEGASIAGMAPHRIATLGIGRTFQIVKPFGSMTARENVAIGALFGSAHERRGMKQAFALADEVLELVGLKTKADQPVTALTIPDRK